MSVKVSDDFVFDKEHIKKSGIRILDVPQEINEEKERKQPLIKRIKQYLLDKLKQIKTKLWRLLRNEKE